MKKLISLSLLFISCICKGQDVKELQEDSLLRITSDGYIKGSRLGWIKVADSAIFSYDSTLIYFYNYPKPKPDTIIKKIIYEYSNIAEYTRWVDTGQIYFYDHSVKWAYGYIVIEWDWHHSFEYYLDADKNKLWKNIIVWKYIEIE